MKKLHQNAIVNWKVELITIGQTQVEVQIQKDVFLERLTFTTAIQCSNDATQARV